MQSDPEREAVSDLLFIQQLHSIAEICLSASWIRKSILWRAVMRAGAAVYALCLLTNPSLAEPVAAPELCPIDDTHTAANIRAVTATKEQQGSAVLVTCRYRKEGGGELTSEVGFNTLCPVSYRIAHPGYALNGTSRTELRISGIVPTAGSDETDFLRLTVFPGVSTRDLDLNVYALCR